jgi:hypothetical protein
MTKLFGDLAYLTLDIITHIKDQGSHLQTPKNKAKRRGTKLSGEVLQ